MIVQRLERAASGAVSIADAKLRARLDHDDDDSDIGRMCITAVLEFEDRAEIALLNQAVRVTLPEWPQRAELALPIGPVIDGDSITLIVGGNENDAFAVSTGLRPVLRLTGPRPPGGVLIEYIAGFGNDGAAIPQDIMHALLDQVATYYDARGAAAGKLLAVSPHFARIAGRYRGVRA